MARDVIFFQFLYSCQCRRGTHPFGPISAGNKGLLRGIHYFLPADYRRHGIAVGHGLGKYGNIRINAVTHMHPADIKTPADGYFVKDQDSADFGRDFANLLQKVIFRFPVPERLNDDYSYVFMFFCQTFQLLNFIVMKWLHIFL